MLIVAQIRRGAMVRLVLTCDRTLTSSFRNIPMLDFLGCAPSEKLPHFLYKGLDTQLPCENGILKIAPYSTRKVETSLIKGGFEGLVVAHPDHVERFIDEGTKVVGISAMDPMGLGPVTMMFTVGGTYTSFTKLAFLDLVKKLSDLRERRSLDFKIVIGGPGAWQVLTYENWHSMGIDHVVMGEIDHKAVEVMESIELGDAEKVVAANGFPKAEELQPIQGASYDGLVEIMRGCRRNCRWCDPSNRRVREVPLDTLLAEISVNTKNGVDHISLHSEDFFQYGLEDKKGFTPNTDRVVELLETAMAQPGVRMANPTHGSIAPVVADPSMIRRLSIVGGAGSDHWMGIQMGLETASSELLSKHMSNKSKPFTPDEWPEIVVRGTCILNAHYWFPAFTAIVGLPGETEEDAMESARLIITMEKVLEERLGKRCHFSVTPLAYIPLGSLRGGEPFDIASSLNEGRFLMIYHSWKHLGKYLPEFTRSALNGSPFNRFIFSPFTRIGSRVILNYLRRWGIRQGFDPDRPLDPLDIDVRSDDVRGL